MRSAFLIASVATLAGLCLTAESAGVVVQGTGDTPSAEALIGEYYANQALISEYSCRFSAKIFSAANQDQVDRAEGDFSGSATGGLFKQGSSELFFVDAGSDFRLSPQPAAEGDQPRLLAPFAGASLEMRNDSFVLSLGALTQSGTIGRRDTFFPDSLFHPFRNLGVIGSGKFQDPLQWLLEPPQPAEVKVELDESGSIARVRSLMGGMEFEIHFDLKRGCAISFCALGDDTAKAKFQVDEFEDLGEGRFVPRKARAMFFNRGEFPQRWIVWQADKWQATCLKDQLQILLVEPGWRIHHEEVLTVATNLSANTVLSPDRLADLLGEVERNGKRPVIVPARQWPRPVPAPVPAAADPAGSQQPGG